ncbi:MAG: hypothetical protein U1E72_15695 [Burkholderiaceae bacterium]
MQELGLRAGSMQVGLHPQGDGRPTVRDRVVQMAAKLVLEPIFEADFEPCSYGFRPRRSATMAIERLRQLGNEGPIVLDADIDYGSRRQTLTLMGSAS